MTNEDLRERALSYSATLHRRAQQITIEAMALQAVASNIKSGALAVAERQLKDCETTEGAVMRVIIRRQLKLEDEE